MGSGFLGFWGFSVGVLGCDCSVHIEPLDWTPVSLPADGWGTDVAMPGEKVQKARGEANCAERISKILKDLIIERLGPALFSTPTLFGMFMAQGDTAVTLNGNNSFSRLKAKISQAGTGVLGLWGFGVLTFWGFGFWSLGHLCRAIRNSFSLSLSRLDFAVPVTTWSLTCGAPGGSTMLSTT